MRPSYNRMAEIIQENIDDPENQEIYMMSADCDEEDIEMFKKAINSRINVKNIVVQTLGPVIGATSGPGTIIVNYRRK